MSKPREYTDAVRELEVVAAKMNTLGEINAGIDALSNRWKAICARAAYAIAVGSVVDVKLKGGKTARGIVMKRNTKSLRVDAVEGFGSWNATPGALEVVTDPDAVAAAKAAYAANGLRIGRGV